ncbi:MAG TPA: cytochrome c3 family protein [Thermodesulfovibrionales bacterium]|nr:cytochrome c3 family protein [Thermodesulfovibrionales bacterium]
MLVVVSARGDSQGISLLYPQDRSLVESKLLSVVISLGGSDIDRIIITRNSKEVESLAVIRGKKFVCKVITIDYGLNTVGIRAMKDGKTVESKEVAVFYRSDLSKKVTKNPPEFQNRPFHTQSREETCKPCHTMEASEKDLKPEKPEDSMCFQCHSKITSLGFVHGPSARWHCLACHEKDSKDSKYVTQKPDRELCLKCHQEKISDWAPKKYVHGPTARGKCTLCHNAHSSDNAFWLKKPTWNLCVTCHEEMGKGKHMLKPFSLPDKKHPTKGIPDPSRPGKQLSCASCHNAHASNYRALFAIDTSDLFEFCQRCHKF